MSWTAEIDLSRSFAPGMGYVALSRVRSMDEVYAVGVNQTALAMHPVVHEFDVVQNRANGIKNSKILPRILQKMKWKRRV